MTTLFPQMDVRAVRLPPAEILVKFHCLRSDEEAFKFVVQYLSRREVLPKILSKAKDKRASERYAELGEKMTEQSLDGAIENFTKSIAFAPVGSQQLAFAYGARAKALAKAGLYEDSLSDITRALALDCANPLKAVLYASRAKCLTALREPRAHIKQAVSSARELLGQLDESDGQIVSQILEEVKRKVSMSKPFKKWNDKRYLPKIPSDNPEIPGASSAVALHHSRARGTHVVATRNIKCGKTLMVHRCYVCVLLTENLYTHCSNCWKQTWSGVPCQSCVNVVYCSESCRDAAWLDYHDIECSVLDSLLAADMTKIGIMSLRIFIKALKEFHTLKDLRAEVQRLDSLPDSKNRGFTGNAFDASKYASFYVLKNAHNYSSIRYKISLDAALIVYALATKTQIFQQTIDNFQSLLTLPFATFVGGLLMKHMGVAKLNGQSFRENREGPLPLAVRGGAIWPFVSLWGSSCDHMTTQLSFADYTAIIAVRPIEKGEEICINFGPYYGKMPTEARQRAMLEQFQIVCECVACRNHWGPHTKFPSFQELGGIKRSDAMELLEALQIFCSRCNPTTEDGLENSKVKTALKTLNLLWTKVKQRCNEIEMVHRTLLYFYTNMGNKYQVLDTRGSSGQQVTALDAFLLQIMELSMTSHLH